MSADLHFCPRCGERSDEIAFCRSLSDCALNLPKPEAWPANVHDFAHEREIRRADADLAVIQKAVGDALKLKGRDLQSIRCPHGRHRVEIAVKRIGLFGDAKVQWQCDPCGLGASGWMPLGDADLTA